MNPGDRRSFSSPLNGRQGGRPLRLGLENLDDVLTWFARGESVDFVARKMGVSRASLHRYLTSWQLENVRVAFCLPLPVPKSRVKLNLLPIWAQVDLELLRFFSVWNRKRIHLNWFAGPQVSEPIKDGRFDMALGSITLTPRHAAGGLGSLPYGWAEDRYSRILCWRKNAAKVKGRQAELVYGIPAQSFYKTVQEKWLPIGSVVRHFGSVIQTETALRQNQVDAIVGFGPHFSVELVQHNELVEIPFSIGYPTQDIVLARQAGDRAQINLTIDRLHRLGLTQLWNQRQFNALFSETDYHNERKKICDRHLRELI